MLEWDKFMLFEEVKEFGLIDRVLFYFLFMDNFLLIDDIVESL